jgi:hypothetical protein
MLTLQDHLRTLLTIRDRYTKTKGILTAQEESLVYTVACLCEHVRDLINYEEEKKKYIIRYRGKVEGYPYQDLYLIAGKPYCVQLGSRHEAGARFCFDRATAEGHANQATRGLDTPYEAFVIEPWII